MSDYVTSVIRTLSALAAGWIITLPIIATLQITGEQWAAAIATTLAAIYHATVRLIETRWPKAGILLGIAKQPNYTTGTQPN